MAFAVIKTGGKQYLVEAGRFIMVEKILDKNVGDSVTFDALLVDDGSTTRVGTPTVQGTTVTGKVVEMGKEDTKIVVKYKAKSRYFKKRGHRQPYAKVMIESI